MLDLNLKEGECLRRSLWGIVERMFALWSWKERMKERLIVVEGNAC